MANYTVSTNFQAKDALPSGNPQKLILGAQLTTEFNNIATSIATKLDQSAQNVNIVAAASGVSLIVNGTINGADIQEWKDGSNVVALFTATGLSAFGTTSNTGFALVTNGTQRLTIGNTGDVAVAGRFAINGATPQTAPSGFGAPVGSITANQTSASTLAQTAGNLAEVIAVLIGAGFMSA